MSDLERRVLLGALGVGAIAALARAGPINPPVGPVSATSKPIGEVEPRTAINAANTPGDATAVHVIQNDGSYYMTGDVSVPAGKIGIKIGGSANDVTIDMNGFKLSGQAGSGNGIATTVAAGGSTLAIRNGKVENMGGAGVSVNAQTLQVEDVSVIDCVGIGLELSGSVGRVSRCGAFRCGSHGISAGLTATVMQCVAEFNSGTGFFSNSVVAYESSVSAFNAGGGFRAGTLKATNCLATGNGGTGYFGFEITAEGSIANGGTLGFHSTNSAAVAILNACAVSSTSGIGFSLGVATGAVLTGCLARGCTGGGYQLGQYATVTGCTATGNGAYGFSCSNAVLSGCTASANGAGSGGANGYVLNAGSRADNCGAADNGGHGFTMGSNCTVTNCSATSNGSGVVSNAGFRSNGGVGTTFDSCTAIGNPVGFSVSSGGCVVTRNRASSSVTNFALGGTNFAGPIVTTAAGVATANAWANFAF